MLRALHRVGLRDKQPFLWRMHNGLRVAIRAEEGLVASETVGWGCFLHRRWEPHVERALREHLRPGHRAIDVGANLGYFTAVMADAVGPSGRVWSFEPTPPIADDLEVSIAANGHSQVEVFRTALGDHAGTVSISFDPRLAGNSSLIGPGSESSTAYPVPMARLDDLYDQGRVGLPRLIKVDVEGAELGVLQGATALITAARPVVVFEVNADMSQAAGWTLRQIADIFASCGPYRLRRLTETGAVDVDPQTFDPTPGSYSDFVALPA